MESWLRIFLLVFVLLYLAIAFVWRSYVVWRQTGINPYVLGKADNAHDYIGQVFRLVMIILLAVIVAYGLGVPGYGYLLSLEWLISPVLQGVGVVLLVLALVWIALAQVQMGRSWRIGIDQERRTELVQQGLFQYSRNPIFLGMRVSLLGFLLAAPNVITLVALVMGDLLMQIQVRLEEAHLLNLHGEAYRAYCQKVRRWL